MYELSDMIMIYCIVDECCFELFLALFFGCLYVVLSVCDAM
jgi:hypothetical protein